MTTQQKRNLHPMISLHSILGFIQFTDICKGQLTFQRCMWIFSDTYLYPWLSWLKYVPRLQKDQTPVSILSLVPLTEEVVPNLNPETVYRGVPLSITIPSPWWIVFSLGTRDSLDNFYISTPLCCESCMKGNEEGQTVRASRGRLSTSTLCRNTHEPFYCVRPYFDGLVWEGSSRNYLLRLGEDPTNIKV